MLRSRPRGNADPDTAWWRVKDARTLRGVSRGVAQTVAAWRERRAGAVDQPLRFVLSDLAITTIAHHPRARSPSSRSCAGSTAGTCVGQMGQRDPGSGAGRARASAGGAAAAAGRRRGPPASSCSGVSHRRGRHSSQPTCASTPRSSRPAPTSPRSCGVTATLDCAPGGGASWWATRYAGWSKGRRRSPSRAAASSRSRSGRAGRSPSTARPCPPSGYRGVRRGAGRRLPALAGRHGPGDPPLRDRTLAPSWTPCGLRWRPAPSAASWTRAPRRARRSSDLVVGVSAASPGTAARASVVERRRRCVRR